MPVVSRMNGAAAPSTSSIHEAVDVGRFVYDAGMAITIGTPIYRRDGTWQASISQSAPAAAEQLVADPGDGYVVQLISVIGTLDADGTVTFLSGAATLTGAMDVAAKTGIAWRGTKDSPFLEAGNSEALKVTTTGGSLRGTIVYRIRPKV